MSRAIELVEQIDSVLKIPTYRKVSRSELIRRVFQANELNKQALAELQKQPPEGEFTMRFRTYLKNEYQTILLEPSKSRNRPETHIELKKQLLSEANYACDRLDQQAEEIEGLKEKNEKKRKRIAEGIVLLEKCLRKIEENRWIPVSERLPELEAVGKEGAAQSPWVHITDGREVVDAYYYDYTKREAKPNYATGKGWYCYGMKKDLITHWKPIILPDKDTE